jgi:hypothetical protein
MVCLPDSPDEAQVVPLPDALHFRRGLHVMKVRDMECEISIPIVDGRTDWTVCLKAWWAVIKIFYDRYRADGDDVPMAMALEMRIMGGSDMLMAPQRGNTHTCSIEVLTTQSVNAVKWRKFTEQVISEWMKITDSAGRPLSVRPRWGKEWDGLTITTPTGHLPMRDYLQDVYGPALAEFRQGLGAVAEAAGGDSPIQLGDLRDTFSNEFFDGFVYDAA